jgi:predicted nucleic acid-binding protein
MEVIDANVAIYAFVEDPLTDRARAVLKAIDRWIVPDIFLGEVGNALSRLVRTRRMSPELARDSLTAVERAPKEIIATSALVTRAFDLAYSLNHGLFDCLYLEVARSRSSRLITADARLIRKLQGRPDASLVIHLADWRP